MGITVGELVQTLRSIDPSIPLGVHVDGDPQGHSLVWDEGYNARENILWLRATKEG